MHKCLLHCTIGHDSHKVLSNSWRPHFQIKNSFCCCFESRFEKSFIILHWAPNLYLLLLVNASYLYNIWWCFLWKSHIKMLLCFPFFKIFPLVKCRLTTYFCSAVGWRGHFKRLICSQSESCISPIVTFYFSSKCMKTHLSLFY